MSTKKINGLTYSQWLSKANDHVEMLAGLSIRDLSDGMSLDEWTDEGCPKEYAEDLLESEGFLL